MTGGSLSWLALFGVLLIFSLTVYSNIIKNKFLIKRGLVFGSILCCMDLVVELVGTHIGKWEYLESSFFINSTVPVELLPIFFSLGFLLSYVHHWMSNSKFEINLDYIFLTMVLVGIVVYIIRAMNEERVTLLMISVPLGMWGFSKISDSQMKAKSLLFAIMIGILDYIIEIIIIGSGNYGYAGGFRPETPLTYTMITLAIIGGIELYESYRKNITTDSEDSA